MGDYGLAAVTARVLVAETHPDDPTDTRLRFGTELVVREIRPGSPAEGVLRPDDAIVAVDGAPVTSFEGSRRITHPPVDRVVHMTIRRRGQEMTVSLTPRESCATLFGPALGPGPQQRSRIAPGEYVQVGEGDGWLGIRFDCPGCRGESEANDVYRANLLMRTQPRVLEVAPGSPAERAGVRIGDVLVRVGDARVPGTAAHLQMGSLRPGMQVRLGLLRNGEEVEVLVTAAEPPRRR